MELANLDTKGEKGLEISVCCTTTGNMSVLRARRVIGLTFSSGDLLRFPVLSHRLSAHVTPCTILIKGLILVFLWCCICLHLVSDCRVLKTLLLCSAWQALSCRHLVECSSDHTDIMFGRTAFRGGVAVEILSFPNRRSRN